MIGLFVRPQTQRERNVVRLWGGALGDADYMTVVVCNSPRVLSDVQYRKWSPTANDPVTANDPQIGPQMILDRKWSPKLTANDPVKTWGMEWILWDWLQKRTDYKKRNLFLAPSKEKGKEDASSQVNLYKAKKSRINLKRIWYQPYTFSIVNCFNFLSRMFRLLKNLKQAGRYVEKTLLS